MSFPQNFLQAIANEKQLTPKETEIFLALYGEGKSRVQINQELYISDSALGTRLSGIYKKFRITGSGSVKESRLKDYLTTKCLSSSSVEVTTSQDINALVKEVRQKIQPYIQERCGTMRVLDMTQPIALGEIYTNVNILEKITGRRRLERSELMPEVSPETFERYCLGDIREHCMGGLEAVEKFSKLMILGKPGAGKTTFLKHLAIQCIGGGFQGDKVPVFITLKEFAETEGKPDLLEYMSRLMPHNVEIPPTPLNKGGYEYEEGSVPPLIRGARGNLQQILNAGRALILLDGLDEVEEIDNSRILRQIKEFSLQFPLNQFVITCRIAAKEYIFEKFTEVEIADFNDEQIADFSGKWFRGKNDPIKAERFLKKLKEDAPIRELATSPLLLTLLCLVFEDTGSFPTNRAELYEQGIEKLLRKWNPLGRERDPIYKKLSPDYREDLLIEIAWNTFNRENYFFKQREIGQQIREYFQSLPGILPEDLLKLDSRAVLESIEAQHGLLVERARGFYSFSHLTFHEYFTARKIVTSCNPYAVDDPTLQMLVIHVTEERWREVFLLTVGMLDSADVLLRLMKAQVDKILAGDKKLQQLLEKIYKIYSSQQFPFTFSAYPLKFISLSRTVIRSLYFEFELRYIHDIAVALDIEQVQYKQGDIGFFNATVLSKTYEFKPRLDIARSLNSQLGRALTKQIDSTFSNPISLKLFKLLDPVKKPTVYQIYYEEENNQETSSIYGAEIGWWKTHGSSWNTTFKNFMFQHQIQLNAEQLSKEKTKQLRKYYNANKLLVDCLNSGCYISREVRQEIEDTLLLPIAEL